MKASEAPAAGWYPDPAGGTRLRWWDGRDWAERWRSAPPSHHIDLEEIAAQARARVEGSGNGGGGDMASQAPGAVGVVRDRRSRQDMDQLLGDMRRIARKEVERATGALTDTAREATTSLEASLKSMADQYIPTVLKWVKRGVGIVVVLGLILFLLQAVGSVAQVRLLDWLGERIDSLVNVAVDPRTTAAWCRAAFGALSGGPLGGG